MLHFLSPTEALAVFVVRSPADLGRAIAELRGEQGLSQAGLAERLGVDRSYVTKLERGHSSPLLDLVFAALAELEGSVFVDSRDPGPQDG